MSSFGVDFLPPPHQRYCTDTLRGLIPITNCTVYHRLLLLVDCIVKRCEYSPVVFFQHILNAERKVLSLIYFASSVNISLKCLLLFCLRLTAVLHYSSNKYLYAWITLFKASSYPVTLTIAKHFTAQIKYRCSFEHYEELYEQL